MAYVSIRGKDKILDFFNLQKTTPIWRLFPTDDARSVIAQNFQFTDHKKASDELANVLKYLDGDNVYTLELFKTDSSKKYTRADQSVNFSLSSDTSVSEAKKVTGTGEKDYADKIKAGFDLVVENSNLRSDKGILQFKYDQLLKENLELKEEIKELEAELDDTVDEMEDAVGSTKDQDRFKEVAADSIEKLRDMLIENFGKGKGKGSLEEKEIVINGLKAINGVRSDKYKEHPIETYIELLKKADPDLHYHFYKLVLLSQHEPKTFKFFLSKLEEM